MNKIAGNHTNATPMTCVLVPLEGLEDAKMQPRSRTRDPRIARFAKELVDLGQLQPIVIDETGKIMLGHSRTAAARAAGWTHINAIVLSGLTWHQQREIFRREAQIVEKPGSWQWFEAFLATGRTADLPRKHVRDIEACQEIFEDERLQVLKENRYAPSIQKTVFLLHGGLSGELRSAGAPAPTLLATGLWLVRHNQKAIAQAYLKKKLSLSIAKRFASAIRRDKPFADV